jgi:hypothetical protein
VFFLTTWSITHWHSPSLSSLVIGAFTLVYIGARKDALNAHTLAALGVAAIVNVTKDIPNAFEDRISYMKIPVDVRQSDYSRFNLWRCDSLVSASCTGPLVSGSRVVF